MDIFVKSAAGVLIAAILGIVLSKQNKELSVLLLVVVCAMVAGAAMTYFEKVVDFIQFLQTKGNLNQGIITVLLKALGIGVLGEIVGMICTDSGNASLAKVIQILSSAVLLWLCIPMFEELMNIIESILGNI